MLRLCELYAIDHNIIFNAKKSQLLYFCSNPSNDPCTVDLTMLNGQSIQYVKKCIHLGNEQLCPTNKHVLIDNAVNDLNCRLNNLLADFAHCSSSTLSALFKTYCMNIYGSQIWAYIVRIVQANFTYIGEKLLGDCGKYRIELITNIFTLLIIVCLLTLL